MQKKCESKRERKSESESKNGDEIETSSWTPFVKYNGRALM